MTATVIFGGDLAFDCHTPSIKVIMRHVMSDPDIAASVREVFTPKELAESSRYDWWHAFKHLSLDAWVDIKRILDGLPQDPTTLVANWHPETQAIFLRDLAEFRELMAERIDQLRGR